MQSDAATVAQNFLELTYNPSGEIIRNRYETLQFVEARYYRRVGEEGIESCLRPWLGDSYSKIKRKISEPQTMKRDEGFTVKLTLGTPPGIGVDRRAIEIRYLTIDIAENGDARIQEDEVLMSVGLDLCR